MFRWVESTLIEVAQLLFYETLVCLRQTQAMFVCNRLRLRLQNRSSFCTSLSNRTFHFLSTVCLGGRAFASLLALPALFRFGLRHSKPISGSSIRRTIIESSSYHNLTSGWFISLPLSGDSYALTGFGSALSLHRESTQDVLTVLAQLSGQFDHRFPSSPCSRRPLR